MGPMAWAAQLTCVSRWTTFNAVTDWTCHTWRRFYEGSSPPLLWPCRGIVPLVLRRVGIRRRQLWRGLARRDLTSRPPPDPAWEVCQTSRRLRGKTGTGDPRSSADQVPRGDNGRLCLASSLLLFPANQRNGSKCTGASPICYALPHWKLCCSLHFPTLASRAFIWHCANGEEKPSCDIEIPGVRPRSGRTKRDKARRKDKLSTKSSAWRTRSCAGWLRASSAEIRVTR